MPRANTRPSARLTLTALALTAATTLAGPLAPPAGAPLPTYKTLTQVEPRTDINSLPGDADSLHRITQPGSYYLSANLSVPAGFRGIEVVAEGVTIDLNGFSIIGQPGSTNGIQFFEDRSVVRNGTITSMGAAGISVRQGFLIEDMAITDCGTFGISADFVGVVQNSYFEGNTNAGISISCCALITNCLFSFGGSGVVGSQELIITNCGFINQNNHAIDIFGGASLITDNRIAFSNSPSIAGIRVASSNTVARNSIHFKDIAIFATGTDNRIEGNTIANCNTGVSSPVGGNLIIRNSFASFGTPFATSSSDLVGTVVDTAASMNAAPNDLINIVY